MFSFFVHVPAEQEPNDENLPALCQGLTGLASVDKADVQNLLTKIVKGSPEVKHRLDDQLLLTKNLSCDFILCDIRSIFIINNLFEGNAGYLKTIFL